MGTQDPVYDVEVVDVLLEVVVAGEPGEVVPVAKLPLHVRKLGLPVDDANLAAVPVAPGGEDLAARNVRRRRGGWLGHRSRAPERRWFGRMAAVDAQNNTPQSARANRQENGKVAGTLRRAVSHGERKLAFCLVLRTAHGVCLLLHGTSQFSRVSRRPRDATCEIVTVYSMIEGVRPPHQPPSSAWQRPASV